MKLPKGRQVFNSRLIELGLKAKNEEEQRSDKSFRWA
jgi:hypothetical protein